MNRWARFIIAILFCFAAGCSSTPKSHEGGCVHDQKLPPLHLTDEQKQLLSTVSRNPKTALDYYMLLPKPVFGIMPDSAKRRITYIRQDTLTPDFLQAYRWFECNGGGFEVTLKVYHTPTDNYIVIQKPCDTEAPAMDAATEENPYVFVYPPELWRYIGHKWIREPENRIPRISSEAALKRYRYFQNRDWKHQYNSSIIWVSYDLKLSCEDVVIMGRGNFQSTIYEYARLQWNGTGFSYR